MARSAEEGPAVAAATAGVPRRRTAMPSSPERVGRAGEKMRLVTKGRSGDGAEKLIFVVPTVDVERVRAFPEGGGFVSRRPLDGGEDD